MAKKAEAHAVIDRKLWLNFKSRCAREGVTASSVVEKLITAHMKRVTKQKKR